MKLLGAVNHRPKFFALISRQMSRKIRSPEKNVFRTISRQILRPFWHSQPVVLSARSAVSWSSLEAQTSLNALSSLIACHHLEASHYHTRDQDERGRDAMFSEKLFTRKLRGRPSAGGAALTKGLRQPIQATCCWHMGFSNKVALVQLSRDVVIKVYESIFWLVEPIVLRLQVHKKVIFYCLQHDVPS